MAGTGIMARIYSSSSPSSYPIEKIGDSPYPYSYLVNAGIPRQNGDGFGQYPRGRVYLPSLHIVSQYSYTHDYNRSNAQKHNISKIIGAVLTKTKNLLLFYIQYI